MRPDLTCYLLQIKFRGSTWEALPAIAHISDSFERRSCIAYSFYMRGETSLRQHQQPVNNA